MALTERDRSKDSQSMKSELDKPTEIFNQMKSDMTKCRSILPQINNNIKSLELFLSESKEKAPGERH